MTIEAGRPATGSTFAATFVLGIEGALTSDDYGLAVQRLEKAVRPWDSVVPMDTRTVGVHCTSLSNVREVEAVAARLADVVRAPMAVGDDTRTLGVCVGAATVRPGEALAGALHRANVAMRQMRQARETRAGLLAAPADPVPATSPAVAAHDAAAAPGAPAVPAQRGSGVLLPG